METYAWETAADWIKRALDAADDQDDEGHVRGRLLLSRGLVRRAATQFAEARDDMIEAARIAMTRHVKRGGKVWIRIFPDKPITKKPAETRMGKGKADTDFGAARVKSGTILYEIAGVPEDLAKQAFSRIAHKMPVKCRFVGRRLAV